MANSKKKPIKSTKSKGKIKAKVKTKPKPKAKVKVKVKPKAKIKIKGQPVAKAKPKAQLRVKSKAQPTKVDFSELVSPLDDRVIVQVQEGEKRTAGGLYIPDSAAVSGNLEGLVVSAGRGRMDKKGKVHAMDLRIGDHVLFPQYAGSSIELLGHKLHILRESEVLGVIQH